ncbi:MAG: carbonic anhydrase family protein [Thermodesulfobacteriota bacterium]
MDNQEKKLPWWYSGTDGPHNWHRFCSIGENQSPIDIVGAKTKELPEIALSYSEEPLRLFRENHTVKAGPFEESSVTLDGANYQLEEFHFHSPSEHLVSSKQFALEAHLVHIGEGGDLIVLAVFIVEGTGKKDYEPLIESFERFGLERDQKDFILIDPSDFIPRDRAYSTYTGSHTTPPCVEGVKWLVFRDPFELSGPQIERLRRVVGENCRPVQPLNGRVIEASF